MKIYGAGSLEDIKKCTELGAVGILTNPQGFEAYFEGKMPLTEITEAILKETELPVFIQIHGKDSKDLIRRGTELHGLSSRVGFKIIADEKGFEAIRELQKHDIRCIATCLFSLPQAAIAAGVGAFGICPFVSRALAIGMDMFQILTAMRNAYDRLDEAPQIIAVSLKGVADVELALAAGVDVSYLAHAMDLEGIAEDSVH
ncbi:MAG TPA: transaldolase family protein [Spirochaetia bacterium]|nr:transaldolase family protein [Spirochaetia bacterium]